MMEKIKNLRHHPIMQQLKDVRVVGLIVFGVIVLLVTWNTIVAIQQNYSLQKQISMLQQEVAVQQLKNKNLQLGQEYYNTKTFLELSARENFGLGEPGETLVIVPQKVALEHTVNLSQTSTEPKKATSKPWYQQNFEAWINFFMGHPLVRN